MNKSLNRPLMLSLNKEPNFYYELFFILLIISITKNNFRAAVCRSLC